jgi:hypothetical protein
MTKKHYKCIRFRLVEFQQFTTKISITGKLKGSTDNAIINRLKSAVNMLQSELVASARQSRGKIISMEGIVNSLRSEMEVLKRSVQK